MFLSQIHVVLIWSIPTLFAITMRETAHGLVAKWYKDHTAWQCGRVTLNPVPHIDLFGTIIFPMLCLLTGGLLFGWAKPVPIVARNLTPRKYAMVFVAFAGSLANVIMAIFWGMLILHHPSFGSNQAFGPH